jgi:hypothetical protein
MIKREAAIFRAELLVIFLRAEATAGQERSSLTTISTLMALDYRKIVIFVRYVTYGKKKIVRFSTNIAIIY